LIEQNGRPDKKIYSLTSKGQNELTSWLAKTPSPPVMRDEFLSKAYAIWLADPFTAQKLFHERIASFQERLDQRKQVLAQMEAELGKDLLNPSSRSFGRYIVHQRKLRLEGEEISWCEWVLSLLTKNTPESSGMRHF
ncbi:MAG: PadR family transcriptional regulator, partial [Clostridia bacterium]